MTKISTIGISGYKSIGKEQSLRLRPLTILAGGNSGGKSSFMQPLLMIKQTLESSFDPGAMLIDGPHVKFNDVSQFLSSLPRQKKSPYFSIRAQGSDKYNLKVVYKKHRNKGVVVDEVTLRDEKFSGGLSLREGKPTPETLSELRAKIIDELPEEFSKIFNKKVKWSVKRDKCFLKIETENNKKGFIGAGVAPCAPLENLCRDILHLPGSRGNPERTYKRTAVGDHFPGTFEEYTASVILEWKNSKKGKDNLSLLGKYLSELGLTSEVDAKKLNDAEVEILVSIAPVKEKISSARKDFASIADVGFGVSQVLPVLTALLTAKKGRIVYLEQPEIHLHPKAQLKLARPLIDAANRGVIVVLETHSSLLLRGVQTCAARGEIDHNNVSLNWFSRDAETWETGIDSVVLDETGASGDWPEDFDDITLDAEREYLDAVEARL